MKNKVLIGLLVVGVVAAFLLGAQTPTFSKEKVVIGNVDAFTGIFAPGPLLWGTIWMETLIADYNADGGLYVPEIGKKLPIETLLSIHYMRNINTH